MGSCPSCFHERLNIHSPFAVAPTERTDELHPNLTPQQLREILAAQPEQALAVAVHRHADAPLRSWLWETGDGVLRMAMYKHYLALREQMAAVGQPLPEAAARFDAAVDRAYGQWQAGFAAPSPEDLTKTSTSNDLVASPQVSPLPQAAAPAHASITPGIETPAVPKSAQLAELRLPDGALVSLTEATVLIGRNPSHEYGEAQLVVFGDDHRLISATHAMLRLHDGFWFIDDLGSTNGTTLGPGSDVPKLPPRETHHLDGEFLLGGLPFMLTSTTGVSQ